MLKKFRDTVLVVLLTVIAFFVLLYVTTRQ